MRITISELEITLHPNDMDLGTYVRSKWMDAKSEFEKDRCIKCGKLSPYKITDPIENRIGYVEGAGQSCFQPNNC